MLKIIFIALSPAKQSKHIKMKIFELYKKYITSILCSECLNQCIVEASRVLN